MEAAAGMAYTARRSGRRSGRVARAALPERV